jgi:PglZ domain
MDSIEATIPSEDARHGDWLHFAYRWAELIALAMGSEIGPSGDIQDRLEGLRAQLDLRFTAWVQRRYGSLINLPPVLPVMLHHVPRYLAHRLGESQQERIAFLLVDGLALDQWVALREVLISQRPRLRFRESAIFAWVPTLTAVSRQAAFAGKPPIYFPSSIYNTEKESALWKQFWVDQGLAQHEVAYMKGLGDGSLDQVNEGLSHSRIHVLGVVIDKVDRIMHGMELGTAGMHNQVRQWARQGFLASFLGLLID